MEAVNVFTVKKLKPLYKGDDEALRIELMQFEEVFQNYKQNHNMLIEGVVLNSWDGQFSCKYMNNEYDSKK